MAALCLASTALAAPELECSVAARYAGLCCANNLWVTAGSSGGLGASVAQGQWSHAPYAFTGGGSASVTYGTAGFSISGSAGGVLNSYVGVTAITRWRDDWTITGRTGQGRVTIGCDWSVQTTGNPSLVDVELAVGRGAAGSLGYWWWSHVFETSTGPWPVSGRYFSQAAPFTFGTPVATGAGVGMIPASWYSGRQMLELSVNGPRSGSMTSNLRLATIRVEWLNPSTGQWEDVHDYALAAASGVDPRRIICPADLNVSGTLTVQDIFDFLAAYFSEDATQADFNNSGTLSVQDIFDFLAAYFAGC